MVAHHELVKKLRAGLSQVLRGKEAVIELALIGIFAGGHVLLEDVPGVGKTTLAKALARSFGVRFTRVQFTPDLLPGDITGSLVLNPESGTFSFHRGPIFTNVLLADEINRASPRTQAALLEAMNESQVTVEGETHALDAPFFVVATQNPADYQGTYPLPEAQLDRFLVRVSIGYPSPPEELQMLFARQKHDPLDDLVPLCSQSELIGIQEAVRNVELKPLVGRYLLAIVEATRADTELSLGVSPRGSLSLFRAAQAHAFLDQRDYVSPEDVKAIAVATLSHRVGLRDEVRYAGGDGADVITRIVSTVRVPA
ncbi:MAG: MoxR family ATPase [Myxococcales bacterium]|nr:MoxR family ATPase [Myxococcales bacterium]